MTPNAAVKFAAARELEARYAVLEAEQRLEEAKFASVDRARDLGRAREALWAAAQALTDAITEQAGAECPLVTPPNRRTGTE